MDFKCNAKNPAERSTFCPDGLVGRSINKFNAVVADVSDMLSSGQTAPPNPSDVSVAKGARTIIAHTRDTNAMIADTETWMNGQH